MQNHVDDAAFGDPTDRAYAVVLPRDNVTELRFDTIDTMKATFGDPYSRTVIGPDGANFNDFPSALAMLTQEVTLTVANPSASGMKIMQIVKAAAGVTSDDLRTCWQAAHQAAAADAPALRHVTHSYRLPEGDPMLAYFGASDMRRYDGLASVWLDGPNPVQAFRTYMAAMQLGAFTEPSLSFFLVVREVEIFSDMPT